ncbi:MAG: protein-glutamate O-methyltransferase CheR [Aquificota bacterium]|nr:protein-glutamate O-methyltransferase CheR [Aquificota bacterium]
MLTDLYFNTLRDLIYENTGIVFDDRKRYFVENRVREHMEELGISSLKEYIYRLKRDKNVLKDFISKITVNETYFYREYYHLKALAYLVQTESFGFPVRVLSLPCSTGEEPYSIAIVLMEVLENPVKFEITGVDIDRNALRKAKEGVYSRRSVSKLPGRYLEKYFDRIGEEMWRIKDSVKRRVRFYEGNILDRLFMKGLGRFHYVFCKNLLIYFDDRARVQAVNNLYDVMVDGGYLFLGHAESISRTSSLFEPVKVEGTIVYRKVREEEEDEW